MDSEVWMQVKIGQHNMNEENNLILNTQKSSLASNDLACGII